MEERIRQAQAGDETAFEQIVAAYAPLATRTALALVHDRAIAEEVVQDTWLNVWRTLPRFDATRPFRPWLLTIVANSCRMILRRKALPSVRLEQVGDDLLAAREDLADHMIRSETDAELTAALAALPPAQRRLIELRYFARLEVTEIALVLAVPEGTVKSRLHRTLAAMRARLQCNEVLSKSAGGQAMNDRFQDSVTSDAAPSERDIERRLLDYLSPPEDPALQGWG